MQNRLGNFPLIRYSIDVREWGGDGDKRRALCNSVKITECSASYIKERFSLFLGRLW